MARDGSKDETYAFFIYEDFTDSSTPSCQPEVCVKIVLQSNQETFHCDSISQLVVQTESNIDCVSSDYNFTCAIFEKIMSSNDC